MAGLQLIALQSLGLLTALFIIRKVIQLVYRVTFHPLAKFPGPLLPALTYKYEFYFDIKGGLYTREIKRMHNIYGPIVRINPDELHCNDPEFIDQVYAGAGKRRNKWSFPNDGVGPTVALAGAFTNDHDLHRLRRAAINRYFSKQSIANLASEIHDFAQRLCDVMLAKAGNNKPFDVTDAYSCFTSDAISWYSFGDVAKTSYLSQESDDFKPNLRASIFATVRPAPITRQWPIVVQTLERLPIWMTKILSKDVGGFMEYLDMATRKIAAVKKSWDAGDKEARSTTGQKTIFHELLNSNLPEHEKGVKRLGAEAVAVLTGGTETTAWTMAVITFHVLDNAEIRSKLTAELQAAVPDPRHLPSWFELEKLPYLSAVLIEAVRLSYGISQRLARIAPTETLVYEGSFVPPGAERERHVRLAIPPGTPVSMSSALLHANERIWPRPDDFWPDRWLNADGSRRKDLESYMVSFGKGTRQCLGMNLAFCEMYFAITALALRVFPRLELYDTTIDDVRYDHDMILPRAKPGSLGVRVLVK